MKYVIKIHSFANRAPCPVAGQYLKSFDPEAYEGRGDAITTRDEKLAMRFPDVQAVMIYMQTQPKSRPLREDGEKNRPLMAFNVHVLPVD